LRNGDAKRHASLIAYEIKLPVKSMKHEIHKRRLDHFTLPKLARGVIAY
jgi:hypothetical protein